MTATPQSTTLPAGYSIRAPRLEDASAVAGLVNACARQQTGADATTVDDIRGQWNDPLRNMDDEDWLVTAPDGRIVGFLELYEYAPFTTYEFDGYVHPDAMRQGIGGLLLHTIDQRARRGIDRAPVGERVTLVTRLWDTNERAHRLLAAHGFSHVRNWRQMQIDFSGTPPAPHWPEGITVRWMQTGKDERGLWAAVEESFADHWGYAPMPFDEFIYYRIEGQPHFDPELVLIAQDGADIAGVAFCLASAAGNPATGWVSVLGVRRAWRGRGIGMALLQHAFCQLHQRGRRSVGLNVDGSSLTGADRLYERAGMHEVRRALYFEKELRHSLPRAG